MIVLKLVFFAVYVNLDVVFCEDPHQVMAKISEAIGRTVLECKKEVTFSNDVIQEFLHYWEPGRPIKVNEMGCVVFCVLVKLQLVEDGGALKKDNFNGFAKANGADEEIVKRLTSVYEECRGSMKFDEPCETGLALATCFREKVFQLHWAPKPGAHYDDEEF